MPLVPQEEAENSLTLADKAVIEATVSQTLLQLGVQTDKPIEMQKDFQHLRDMREATEAVKRKGILLLAGCLFSGVIAACWLAFKEVLKA